MVWGRKEKRTTPDEGRRHGLMKICGVGKADGTLFLYTFVPEKTKCSDAPWRNAPVMRLEQGAAAGKMKKRMMRNLAWKCILTVVCLLYGAAGKAAGREVIRVACIGNSITYGAGIANREQNSYPAQLQAYLGPDYEVRNFGVSATTLLRSGDYPYVRTAAYRQALDFAPQVVLLKFGTNDTKPQNWRHKAEFVADYCRMIDTLRALPSHPRIILLTPIRCFLEEGSSTISQARIGGEVIPMVEEVAWRKGLEIVDLHHLFGHTWAGHLLPDRLHPSAIGAGMMAQHIGSYLLRQSEVADPQRLPFLQGATAFDFHGFRGYAFRMEGGVDCKVVVPWREATGRPWVWRARFWGHEPQTDVALLEQGFYVAYCDVADLYGSAAALARWDRFYDLLTRQGGFSRKVVLEGMSRGGLPVYNWAARHPRRVACIYADAPVMDISSWPMGRGRGQLSEADVQALLQAYGFKQEAEAAQWRHNPIDAARRIARAGIPCLHVVGDADSVVPVAENTAPFEAAMRRHGGNIQVIHKPGVGHHPHSLTDPGPIVRFILRATGRYHNACTLAVPGNEYRPGAGWVAGTDWYAQAADIRKVLEGRQLELLWLGNSIVQGWGGQRAAVTHKPGRAAMDTLRWETAGISGDRTQNLLWRLQHEGYGACRPKNVAIAIGVNNLLDGADTPEEVAEGIIRVTDEARRQFPEAHVWLFGLLPAGHDPQGGLRQAYEAVHRALRRHRFDRAVTYVDAAPWLLTAEGALQPDSYSADGIHLTAGGYRRWAAGMKQLLEGRP